MPFGLFISASPTAEALRRASRLLADALARGDSLRMAFFYAEAAAAVDPSRLPAPAQAALTDLLAAIQASGASCLVCQSALEKLAVSPVEQSPIRVGSLGQWFDLLHELDRVESVGR